MFQCLRLVPQRGINKAKNMLKKEKDSGQITTTGKAITLLKRQEEQGPKENTQQQNVKSAEKKISALIGIMLMVIQKITTNQM